MPISELGFAEVPWDVESADAGSLEGLPPAPARFVGGTVCLSEWASNPDSGTWMCTRPTGHDGTHRAGDSVGTVAEWRDEDQVATVTRPKCSCVEIRRAPGEVTHDMTGCPVHDPQDTASAPNPGGRS